MISSLLLLVVMEDMEQLSRVYCCIVVQQSNARELLSHTVTLQNVKPAQLT